MFGCPITTTAEYVFLLSLLLLSKWAIVVIAAQARDDYTWVLLDATTHRAKNGISAADWHCVIEFYM